MSQCASDKQNRTKLIQPMPGQLFLSVCDLLCQTDFVGGVFVSLYLSGHTGHFSICARGGAWACAIPQRFIICKRVGEQKQGLDVFWVAVP